MENFSAENFRYMCAHKKCDQHTYTHIHTHTDTQMRIQTRDQRECDSWVPKCVWIIIVTHVFQPWIRNHGSIYKLSQVSTWICLRIPVRAIIIADYRLKCSYQFWLRRTTEINWRATAPVNFTGGMNRTHALMPSCSSLMQTHLHTDIPIYNQCLWLFITFLKYSLHIYI